VGRFAPGSSGNPGGRPKGLVQFREELEAAYGEDLIRVIGEALHDEDVRVRLEAAKFAVAYLYGRPGAIEPGATMSYSRPSADDLAEAKRVLGTARDDDDFS